MSTATLKTKVRQLAADLSQYGFEHLGPYLIKRPRPNLDQFIELQPGHRSLEGKFTCNLAWKLTYPEIPSPESAFHYSERMGSWLPHEPREAMEESYRQLLRAVEVYALPFLNSCDSVEKIVAKYEDAIAHPSDMLPPADSPVFFLGRDEGWKHCCLGVAYKHLGCVQKACHHLKLVIDQHSNYPYDWVAKRKQACERVLSGMP